MKHSFFITAFLWLVVNTGSAQYFNNNYEIVGETEFFATPIYKDSSIFVIGNWFQGSEIGTLLAKVDLNGDTVFVKRYMKDSCRYASGYGVNIVEKNNIFYCINSYRKPPSFAYVGGVYKINSSADTIAKIELDSSYGIFFHSLCLTNDNCLAVAGHSNTTSITGNDVFLMKIDTNLNLLWSKEHGGLSEDQGWKIDTTSDKGFIIGGLTQSFGAGLRDAYLIKTDSLGDLQWQKTYGGSDYDGGKAFTINGDTIVFYGAYNLGGSGDDRNLFLQKYDYSGNLLFTKSSIVTKNLLNTIECLKDGNCLYFNNYCIVDSISAFNTVGNIIKTDLNGNVIYDRAYKLSESDNYTSGMIQLPDKSLVTSGYLFDDGIAIATQDAWLFRVDSMGCFIPGCFLGLNDELPHYNLMNLFPNPNNGSFTLDLNSQCIFPLQYSIIDLGGRTCYSGFITNVHTFIQANQVTNGLYYLKVSGNGFCSFLKFNKQY